MGTAVCFSFWLQCARLSCILSFRVHVKLFYRIVSYRLRFQFHHAACFLYGILPGEHDVERFQVTSSVFVDAVMSDCIAYSKIVRTTATYRSKWDQLERLQLVSYFNFLLNQSRFAAFNEMLQRMTLYICHYIDKCKPIHNIFSP